MDFNELIKFIKPHLINIGLIIIFYLSIQLLYKYFGMRLAINWYTLVGVIIGYILAETIKTIYYKKGPI